MTTKQLQQTDFQVRLMIRRDMPEVLEIERQRCVEPWCEEQILIYLRQRNCIGMVAERHDRICGFMIYELLKDQLHVVKLVGAADCASIVMASLIDCLKNKLSQQRRQRLVISIAERELWTQQLLRSEGLICTEVIKAEDEHEDDLYQFVFDVEWKF